MGLLEEQIEKAVSPIWKIVHQQQEQIEILLALQNNMLPTEDAVKFTGVCARTLVKLAKDENSPVVMKKHGTKNLFDRNSLIAFNKQQLMRKRVDPGRVRSQFLRA